MQFYFEVLKMSGLKDPDSNTIIIPITWKQASGMEWAKYNVL